MKILKSIFDHEYKELKKFEAIADKIEALNSEYSSMSDDDLKAKTSEFKDRLSNGETLDDICVEAFATVREAAYRVIGEKPFRVQILGGLAIHFGNIAEMKTGEGKTLTSTMPAYLNALTGEGVHIITVNDYLAGRDSSWMGKIYEFLGLTVGFNTRDLTPKEKQDAYNSDILYTTNNELGFDYLRDNMVVKSEARVQRPFNYAIIDEVDSVLIDEARTPLIISGGAIKTANLYTGADTFVKRLKLDEDYTIDEKMNTASLSDSGVSKAEKEFNVSNLYDIENTALVHHINQALRANYCMKNEVDYIVQEGEIVIVDPFTGRLMKGRAYSDGLHQAIEAKEGVKINQETVTLATITFQNLFRMYKKLSGMTGTAKTEEEEFRNIYNMYVICIPTNRPVVREDLVDLVYATKEYKFNAIVREIRERKKVGQPVLVGTVAIETSELISKMLTKAGIKHEVLNAKNHAREAEIIAKAGQKGSVTIATNMAGRGTDIKLGEGVKELGGLCIIGTERHESRRIDNQLRGRAGRQGDPGFSQFYVSLEDDLMVRTGVDRVKGMLQSLGVDGDTPLRMKTFANSIESAQKRMEGNNFDMRKTLLQYDDVMNQQREIIYERRNEILDNESIHDTVIDTFKSHIKLLVEGHIMPEGYLTDNDYSEIVENVNDNLLVNNRIKVDDITSSSTDEVVEKLTNICIDNYDNKFKEIPKSVMDDFEKAIALRVIDTHWMENINTMSHLREGIGLRGYAQENPLQAYTMEGFEMFDRMLANIDKDITTYLSKSEVRQNLERKEVVKSNTIRTNESDSSKSKREPKRTEKIGRNDPCPCGSGKKYKQCCGK